jgi:hypothetical protein
MKKTVQITRLSNDFSGSRRANFFFKFTLFLFFTAGFVLSASAQQQNVIKDMVPPPLPIISKGESERLASEADMKKRVQLALELMEIRLKKAEALSSEKKYRESLDELGGFQAIMNDALRYLQRNDNRSKKVLNNFKRFEINLRSFVPRLELVRRLMPEKFAYHVVQLMKSVRKARSNAVEPLFDNTVVSDSY